MKRKFNQLISILLLILLSLYQNIISPFTTPSCRYYPSCSSYAKYTLKHLGFKGLLLVLKRLLKCNPFFKGGYDPVPIIIYKKKKYE